MYEILIPTVQTQRFRHHQILADIREVYSLENAILQCHHMPGYLYVRSTAPFPGSYKRKIKNSGLVEFELFYCCSANHNGKPKVKNDDQIVDSLKRAALEGGLAEVSVAVKEFHFEDFKSGFDRKASRLPIAKVNVRGTVIDGDQFKRMVMVGIGKRRSYGLGMMLFSKDYYVA